MRESTETDLRILIGRLSVNAVPSGPSPPVRQHSSMILSPGCQRLATAAAALLAAGRFSLVVSMNVPIVIPAITSPVESAAISRGGRASRAATSTSAAGSEVITLRGNIMLWCGCELTMIATVGAARAIAVSITVSC